MRSRKTDSRYEDDIGRTTIRFLYLASEWTTCEAAGGCALNWASSIYSTPSSFVRFLFTWRRSVGGSRKSSAYSLALQSIRRALLAASPSLPRRSQQRRRRRLTTEAKAKRRRRRFLASNSCNPVVGERRTPSLYSSSSIFAGGLYNFSSVVVLDALAPKERRTNLIEQVEEKKKIIGKSDWPVGLRWRTPEISPQGRRLERG